MGRKTKKRGLINRSKKLYGCSRCFFCFRDCTGRETADHLIPYHIVGSKLGETNKVLACARCNYEKAEITSHIATLNAIQYRKYQYKKIDINKAKKIENKMIQLLGANFIEV